jgi:adenylate cyclase
MGSRPSLDIDLLRTFVRIAEEKSFTRAAERVGRTQSAVSLQMQRLESLVGHCLIERGKSTGINLTVQGSYLLERALELLSLNDDILDSIAGGAVSHSECKTPATDLPSIAVLPFQYSSDERREGLAAGFVNGIIAGLSRIGWLAVIAQSSMLVYKSADVRQVGRELNVRYVLQGTVDQSGARVRITVRLLEAEARKHLWAESYDGVLEDAFDLQDQIAAQIVSLIEPRLRRSEVDRSRRAPTSSLDAFHLYLLAFQHVAAQMPGDASKALPLLRQALKLDPNFTAAHALLGWCHELCFARGGLKKEDRNAALLHAGAAIAGDNSDGTTLSIAGFVMALLTGDSEAALPTIERGLSMNPSSATVLYLGAQAYALTGRRRLAASLADRALRLSPADAFAFQAHMALGETALQEDRFHDAASCFSRAAQAKPNFSTAHIYQAIALAQAGRPNEATNRLARGFELEPGFTPRAFFAHAIDDSLRIALVDGARRLGLQA